MFQNPYHIMLFTPGSSRPDQVNKGLLTRAQCEPVSARLWKASATERVSVPFQFNDGKNTRRSLINGRGYR